MRKRTIILVFVALLIIPLLVLLWIYGAPKRKIFESPLNDGKYITVFRPIQHLWDNYYYIMPYKYTGNGLPQHDYFVLSPMEDQDMSVNWNPVEKYDLIISLPFCDYIQEVYYEIDTSKYAILSHCGNNGNAYIDEVDSLNPPGNKYSYIKLSEWLP